MPYRIPPDVVLFSYIRGDFVYCPFLLVRFKSAATPSSTYRPGQLVPVVLTFAHCPVLYVHGNPSGRYQAGSDALTISDLTEQFIQAQISWEEALSIVQTKKIVYAPDATMQAVLSDRYGRTLLIEPGIGSRVDTGTYSLMANASLLSPESTRPWLLPGDNRYEKAAQLLAKQGRRFSVSDAFAILRAVRQEGLWATRVSFVFSAKQRTVFYAENSHFDSIQTYQFPPV